MSSTAVGSSERDTRVPGSVWLLAAGTFVIAIGIGIVAPALPTFASRFDVGTAAITLVISVFAFVRLLTMPLVGRIMSRFGERTVYTWGILIAGTCTGICAFAAEYWQLLAFRGLAGAGSTMLTVSAAVLLVQLAPPTQRGRATGLIATASMLGRILGPLVGGLLEDFDMRLPFLAYGVMMAALALLSRRMLRGVTVTERETTGQQKSVAAAGFFRHPTYRAVLAANFAVDGWAIAGLQTALLPLFIPEVLHGSGALVGSSLSAFAAGNVAILTITGRFTDRFGRKPVAVAGLAISAVATLSLSSVGSVPALLAASLVAGAGAGMLTPPNSSAAADIANLSANSPAVRQSTRFRRRTERRSTVLVGAQMAGDIGAIIGPYALGVVATVLSYREAFYLAAAVITLAALVWLMAKETAPSRNDEELLEVPQQDVEITRSRVTSYPIPTAIGLPAIADTYQYGIVISHLSNEGSGTPPVSRPLPPPAIMERGLRNMSDHQQHDQGSAEPIAIVGMACRLGGGIRSSEEFWDLLLDGEHVTSEIPADRWAEHATDPRNVATLRRTVRHGAFLDDITGFDAAFFNLVPREAEQLDPQQRILLETTWEALENAGIPPTSLAGTNAGVYIGAVSNDYERRLLEDVPNIEAWSGICTQMCGQSNRISYTLDLRGPSLTVDTACSASLVAVHLARQALASGEIPLAIVGGANVVAGPGLTVMLDAAGALSPDGRSKAFDASADGYGRGEGCAVVVLKRLSDAQRAGDRVLGVIRGSAVHQDGRTNGIMAPSATAQAQMLDRAYGDAELGPRTIDYVEAHGTGTPLGDPMEAAALAEVLGAGREPEKPLLIGSAKPNIGHLEAGAGVAAIIKVVLAMRHGKIPPNLIFTKVTEEIPWETSGLRLVTETTPWPASDHPRRAGVSGYGYGGTLAHIILEEAPQTATNEPTPDGEEPRLFPISGATEAGLRANAARLADWLERDFSPGSLTAVGHTLSARRAQLAQRAAIVAATPDELADRLRAAASGAEIESVALGGPLPSAPANPVWVFSGHGSQWAGMGRELLSTDETFAQVIDDLGPVFQAEIGFTPREILLGGELSTADVIQPMIYSVQVALAEVWRRHGVEPAAVIGHSVGEIAAAVTAGALSRHDGAKLVCRRAILLRKVAGQGAMVMVHLSFDEAAARLAGRTDVVPAISSAPLWTVIAGDIAAVEELAEAWHAEGLIVRRVASDVAFHSPAMDPLLADLRAAANDITPKAPTTPIYTTTFDEPRRVRPHDGDYWAANLRNPVRFSDAISAAVEDGHRVFLEISSHPVLTHSISETLTYLGAEDVLVTGTLRRNAPERTTLLAALGRLHCHGVQIDFEAMFPNRDLAELPTTAWQHRHFWRASSKIGTGALLHEVESHTLLGGLTTVAGTSPLRLWQTHLDYASRPYPGNHPVRGVEIIPATVVLTTFHEAARATSDGAILRDVNLRSPISLEGSREIQVSLQDGTLRLSSRLSSNADEEAWSTHTTASIDTNPPVLDATLDASALRKRCREQLPAGFVHDLLASLDVPAMGFPWRVEELRRQTDAELFAVVSSGEQSPTSWASLLDAALSLPTAVFPGTPTLRMPSVIDQISLSDNAAVDGRTPETVLMHIRLEDRPDTVNVTIADTDGRVVAQLHGLRFGVLPVLPKTTDDGAGQPPDHEGFDWSGTDLDELRDRLAADVRTRVAEVIKLPTDELNVRKPLTDMGIDSVLTLILVQRLEKRFRVQLPTTLLWNHPTINAIIDYLAEQLNQVVSSVARA